MTGQIGQNKQTVTRFVNYLAVKVEFIGLDFKFVLFFHFQAMFQRFT